MLQKITICVITPGLLDETHSGYQVSPVTTTATTIMRGKDVADSVYAGLSARIAGLSRPAKVVFIRVGEDPASVTYVNAKAKRCEGLGLIGETWVVDAKASQQELDGLISKANEDPNIDGILVQLPLPKHLDKKKTLDAIDPSKDVDGLHASNMGRLLQGNPLFVSCTPAGIMEILKFYKIPIEGQRAVVVGRSDIVGKPVAQLLGQYNATVTVCHSRTKHLAEEASRADILVVAMGIPGFIGAEHVKAGAVVIDVGIHRVDGKLVGDVRFDEVAPKVSAITPVPGGVGPMTIAMLMHNVVCAAELHLQKH